jgi:hypothetical protein
MLKCNWTDTFNGCRFRSKPKRHREDRKIFETFETFKKNGIQSNLFNRCRRWYSRRFGRGVVAAKQFQTIGNSGAQCGHGGRNVHLCTRTWCQCAGRCGLWRTATLG